MDMKKLISIVDHNGTDKKSVLTESTDMAQQMVMQQYSQTQQPARMFKSNINEYLKIVDSEMLGAVQEQQEQKKIAVKQTVNRVLSRMDEAKTAKTDAPKPRNFVAKNATTSGAGAHKDKKKADKQGDVKHKSNQLEQDVAEGSGGDQYKIKSIGRDSKGDYYVSPSTGKKVYKSGVKRGDHENPKTGEHKGVSKASELAELRTEVKDKDGKVTSWKDEGEWKKAEKNKDGKEKDPRGKVANLSDKARRETEKELKESYGSVEIGAPVKVYSNVLKKAVFGKVVKLKEGRVYVQYDNTKIVMGHPIDSVQLNEAALGAAGKMASRFLPGVGAAVGAYDAYDRAKKGDYIGAGLSGLAGLTSLIPGVGTAAAMGLTGAQLARDYKKKTGAFAPDPAPGAMTPNPAVKTSAAPAVTDTKAMQTALAAAGAKNINGTPLVADGKMGSNTQAAMKNPQYAAIVKKFTTSGQAATPKTDSNLAAFARTVTPAAAAAARGF